MSRNERIVLDMSNHTTTKSAAYTRGYDAVEFGDCEDDNPFDSYLEETDHAEWLAGLADGFADRSNEAIAEGVDVFVWEAFDSEDDWCEWLDELHDARFDGDLIDLL